MKRALLMATLLALAGCLGPAPADEGPAPADPGPPAGSPTDAPASPSTPSTPDGPAPAGTDPRSPWALTGVDCLHEYFVTVADRAAVVERLPEGLMSYGNSSVAFAYFYIHSCAALVHGNDALQEDATLYTLFVDVVHDGERQMFLLEALSDWPHLVDRLDDLGATVRSMEVRRADPLGSVTLAGEGFQYEAPLGVTGEGDPLRDLNYQLRTGKDGEHLLAYEIVRASVAEPLHPSTVQAQGGVLGEIYFGGSSAATRYEASGGFRITQQFESPEEE